MYVVDPCTNLRRNNRGKDFFSAGARKLKGTRNYLFRGVRKFGEQKFKGAKIKGIKVVPKGKKLTPDLFPLKSSYLFSHLPN